MRLDFCVGCGARDNIYQHHLVPKSCNGQVEITLCGKCHGLIHDVKEFTTRALTRSALNKRKLAGKRIGTIPYGFELGKDNSLVKCEEEQAIIEIMCALKESMSYRRLAMELNSRGIMPRSGRLWHFQVVRDILLRKKSTC